MGIELLYNEKIKRELPEINNIYIGGCGATKKHRQPDPGKIGTFIRAIAHTHICPNDSKSFKSICCPHEKLLIKEGEFTPILWHEYAHVLEIDEVLKDVKNIICKGFDVHDIYYSSSEAQTWIDHGEVWKKIMRSLNQEPTTFAAITEEEAALIVWQEPKKLAWSDK